MGMHLSWLCSSHFFLRDAKIRVKSQDQHERGTLSHGSRHEFCLWRSVLVRGAIFCGVVRRCCEALQNLGYSWEPSQRATLYSEGGPTSTHEVRTQVNAVIP